jgi:regulator of sigma E protease
VIYLFAVFTVGLLILAHEFGHFLAARCLGLPVKRLSLGLGPTLWMGHWRGIEVRLGVVPVAGYVLLDYKGHIEYLDLPLWKRVIFALGGPLANLVLAVVLAACFALASGLYSWHSLFVGPLVLTFSLLSKIVSAFVQIPSHPEMVSGVLGIVAEGGRYMGSGLVEGLYFALVISLNLAFLNLIPIPPLDGGRIALDLIQRLNRRLTRLYIPLSLAGGVVVISLMIYATGKDIFRYFT